MKSFVLAGCVCGLLTVQTHALVINEILSNPTGDDSGREWVELYNDTEENIDLSSLTISIKGATPLVVTPLQGGTILSAGGHALVSSTVSGQTKFIQDYPSYSGILLRSSISLVNTGSTSIEIKHNGSTIAGPVAYTAAKEGVSLSFIEGAYVSGSPTPGARNSAVDVSSDAMTSTTTVTTLSQTTVAQLSPPLSDMAIYLPEEKLAIAGAASEFTVFSTTRAGKPINDLRYMWAFGDGGQGTGSSTNYTYSYPGRYIAHVEAGNLYVVGSARTVVRVVAPDLELVSAGSGKYGSYIDVRNPNPYLLDLSQWGFSINGAFFPFPKNTIILPQQTTRFSGVAMGFASSTLSSSTSIRVLFPNLEEVTRYAPAETAAPSVAVPVPGIAMTATKKTSVGNKPSSPTRKATSKSNSAILGTSTSRLPVSTGTSSLVYASSSVQKDTRIVSWLKTFFGGR